MKISQREARRLRRRVQQLETAEIKRRSAWSSEYPGGVNICNILYSQDDFHAVAIRTARKLGHAVVVVERSGELNFMALPLPEVV